MRVILAVVAVALSGCADIPRDPERTETQVRQSATIRLGWVTGTAPDAAAAATLDTVARATNARVERREGDSEMLLTDLEEGRVDLVHGRFAMGSPWAKHVHLGRALGYRAEPPGHVSAPRFVYRNGENGWIMLVEQAAKP